MRPRTALFGTFGLLATGVGAGLLFAPGLVRELGPIDGAVTAVGTVETATVGLAASALALLAFFVAVRSQPTAEPVGGHSSVDSRFERATRPEQSITDKTPLAGSTLDADVEQAVEHGGEAFRDVRAALYETATSVYAERADVPESEAAAAVDRGVWTDDPVAARFLGQEQLPLAMRLRRWLVPVRERERRIERTVVAIERVSGR